MALHDETTDLIEFAYYIENGERDQARAMQFGEGLTSRILREREPLLLKGRHAFKGADGKEDGTFGHFHFQITASGLGNAGSNSEAELFQKVPDIDTVNQHLNATDSHVIVTIRAIGEMQPDNGASNVTLDLDPSQVDYGERKAYVNLQPKLKDMQLWEAMDRASDELAVAFANLRKIDILHPVSGVAPSRLRPPPVGSTKSAPPPSGCAGRAGRAGTPVPTPRPGAGMQDFRRE